MYKYKGKTALITGASSGIGAVFARQLAARGMDVVLVARTETRLRSLADELTKQYGVKAEVMTADLAQPGVAHTIYQETQSRQITIDMLVNNAGFSTFGSFETIEAQKEQQEIAVNIAALVDLVHVFVPAMLAKGEGSVINVASVAGFIPTPRQAVYGASKAFVLSFSEALYAEYQGRGIKVFTLCPGATSTEFFDEINIQKPNGVQTPEQVVSIGLRAFERGRHYVICGVGNKVSMLLPRLLPRAITLQLINRVSRDMMKPRSGGTTTK